MQPVNCETRKPEGENRRPSRQAALTVLLFAAVILGFSAAGWILPDQETSRSERRRLAQAPELSGEAVWSGRFMEEAEAYTQDQFPLRESFRTLKALTASWALGQKDSHGIYVADGYAAKWDGGLSAESVDYAAERFRYVYQRYLEGTDARVYVSVIPDKSQFLAEENGYPWVDFQALTERLAEQMPYASYIDIAPLLEKEDYYRTDIHWRQERLTDVAAALAEAMGAEVTEPEAAGDEVAEPEGGAVSWRAVTLPEPFYGVYRGQSALPMEPDPLTYLEADFLENCQVYDYETGAELPVYNRDAAEGLDPYDLFLSGSKSLLRLENPEAPEGKRLILFRDSFGSSLAPLLAEGYREIFLVDIRYLSPAALGTFVSFEGADVLFLYSESVLNHSETLK